MTAPDNQYVVEFALGAGRKFTLSLRWKDWNDAAKYGEEEVKAKRAIGFWVKVDRRIKEITE